MRTTSTLLAAAVLLLPDTAGAQLATCAAIADDRARLACYDALARQASRAPAPTPAPATTAATGPATNSPVAAGAPTGGPAPAQGRLPATSAPDGQPVAAAEASDLERRWELRPDLRHGVLRLAPYRPLYLLVHATDRINAHPESPTRGMAASDVDLQRVEAKLQLSFRTKVAEDVLGSGTDAWFGYTQQSYWQAANSRYSSPFRETDYEPEFIVLHPLDVGAAGVHARYAAVSFTHQSNGRGEALSRSWNRLIGDLALESGPWSVHLRPWVRAFDATGTRDDNPDIEDYVGRGEIVTTYRADGHVVTLRGRHSLRSGDRSHGSAQLDWAFPLAGALNGHLQLFNGFGENLIDYNHRQTTVGVGISFVD